MKHSELRAASARLLRARGGASGFTYGLLVGMVGILAIGAVTTGGDSVGDLFGDVSGGLNDVMEAAGDGDGAGEDTPPAGSLYVGNGSGDCSAESPCTLSEVQQADGYVEGATVVLTENIGITVGEGLTLLGGMTLTGASGTRSIAKTGAGLCTQTDVDNADDICEDCGPDTPGYAEACGSSGGREFLVDLAPGASGVTIRNVAFIGPADGIDMSAGSDLTVEDADFSELGLTGIRAVPLQGALTVSGSSFSLSAPSGDNTVYEPIRAIAGDAAGSVSVHDNSFEGTGPINIASEGPGEGISATVHDNQFTNGYGRGVMCSAFGNVAPLDCDVRDNDFTGYFAGPLSLSGRNVTMIRNTGSRANPTEPGGGAYVDAALTGGGAGIFQDNSFTGYPYGFILAIWSGSEPAAITFTGNHLSHIQNQGYQVILGASMPVTMDFSGNSADDLMGANLPGAIITNYAADVCLSADGNDFSSHGFAIVNNGGVPIRLEPPTGNTPAPSTSGTINSIAEDGCG
jgi:hypothetical protein